MISKTAVENKPFFLFLLPLFFVINGYNDFFNFFPVKFILVNYFLTSLFVLLVYIISKKSWKDEKKAALFTFLFCCFCILFGFFHDVVKKAFPNQFFGRYIFILPLSFVLLITFSFFLRRKRSQFIKAYQYLNLLLVILIAFEVIRTIVLTITYKEGSLLIDSRFTVYKQVQHDKKVPDSLKPDIFFLIFDCMPSSKSLQIGAGFDNTATDSFLTKKKFYIAKDARSNYNLTVLSVTSTLNMEYIQEDEIYKQSGIHMYFRSASSLFENSLIKILSAQGYSIHQYQPLSLINNDERKGEGPFSQMLYMNYFYRTLPGRLYRDLAWNLTRIQYGFFKKWNQHQYQKKAKSADIDIRLTTQFVKKLCSFSNKPKFAYAHFMLPHPPYFFDSTGKLKPFNSSLLNSEKTEKNNFLAQVKFTNIIIKDLVNSIQLTNRKNTIIIIAGDHGVQFNKKEKNLYFHNMNAIYFPDGDYKTLYPDLSPVNTFRLILNKYFNSNLPVLKDSSVWISPNIVPFEE
jgi:Sulfatase